MNINKAFKFLFRFIFISLQRSSELIGLDLSKNLPNTHILKFRVFWDVMPCSPVEVDGHCIPADSKLHTRRRENLKSLIPWLMNVLKNVNDKFLIHRNTSSVCRNLLRNKRNTIDSQFWAPASLGFHADTASILKP
jgi:hypothetical protein